MSIESVMPSSHLILCCLLLLPSIFPSIRVFSNESALPIRWPMYWSFSFSISPSNEYSGLISFRMDLLHLLAVQGTLKSLLQYHSSKASILWHSAFFKVQLLHLYMTTGKTIALTIRIFVSKVIYFCFLIHCLGWSKLSNCHWFQHVCSILFQLFVLTSLFVESSCLVGMFEWKDFLSLCIRKHFLSFWTLTNGPNVVNFSRGFAWVVVRIQK